MPERIFLTKINFEKIRWQNIPSMQRIKSFDLVVTNNCDISVTREELKSRYSLGSKEMQVAIQDEVKRLEKEHNVQLKAQQDK